ncbi:MAG: hypothetical protein FWD17_08805, partial [Polyangiaceae bacterium]|nr:hypothetical protein [Polyangiaceae bacterium]
MTGKRVRSALWAFALATIGCGGSEGVLPDTSSSVPPDGSGGPSDAAGGESRDGSADATLDAIAPGDASPTQGADAAGLIFDASGLPFDASVPNVPLGDGGATVDTCLGCITSSCSAEVSACILDPACVAEVGALQACLNGGQSLSACGAQADAGPALTAIAT